MSVTRIICTPCGFPIAWCTCASGLEQNMRVCTKEENDEIMEALRSATTMVFEGEEHDITGWLNGEQCEMMLDQSDGIVKQTTHDRIEKWP